MDAMNKRPLVIGSIGVSAFMMLIIVVIAAYIVVKNGVDSFKFYIIIFGLYEVIITIVNQAYPISNMPFKAVEMLCWISVFIISYNCVLYDNNMKKYVYSAVALFFPFSFYFWSTFNLRFDEESQGVLLLNIVFFLLFLMPLIMLLKSNKFKYLYILVIFSAIIMSSKRSAIIAFVAAIAVYFIFQIKKQKKATGKLGQILLVVILIVIAVTVFDNLSMNYNLDIIGRMESISDDGGSGRTRIWGRMWDYMKDQTIFEWMMGHGYRTTGEFGGAHNDFLEILYDYGIVGFLLFLMFIIKIIKYFFQMNAVNYKHTDSFAVSLVILIVEAAVSQVIIMPYWFLLMSLYWGYVIADYEKYVKEVNLV